MKKLLKAFLVLAALVFVFAAQVAGAKPDFNLASVIPSGGKAVVVIPDKAVAVAPGVFNLGTVVVNGKKIEGYAFVDYRKDFAKPSGCNLDGVCQGWEDAGCLDCNGGSETDSNCFGFLAKGAKWKTPEPYWVNADNEGGLKKSFVVSNLAANIDKWEAAAGTEILGGGSPTEEILVADLVSPDFKNEVYFADIDSPGAIGVTIVWGIFRGAPSQRELVEWDQVYDDLDFDWSDDGGAGKMDFENIATHELGHTVGLDDLYQEACSQQTMYGYASEGETEKRSLEAGDIAGIKALY